MADTSNQEPEPHHGAVKIYDRPKSASKVSPAIIGVALLVVLLIVFYELYHYFAHK